MSIIYYSIHTITHLALLLAFLHLLHIIDILYYYNTTFMCRSHAINSRDHNIIIKAGPAGHEQDGGDFNIYLFFSGVCHSGATAVSPCVCDIESNNLS